ncbi:thioredoxin [Halapricum desulfuricans]|uniref:Thiol-disulfide isomerase or thioredoxin n=1 Tax=Halapricum desulfuricans TaxID=2841257 RepID=A0A897N2U3_9EURY|nr:thioredoxin [Halapricum desulfuricans]QSG06811.1 Thiol-disulfide isomerase or thioredoxin [Halapricum desulfuricans]
MSEADELEEIKQQKMQELQSDDSAGAETPDEPIHVESSDHYQEILGDYDVVLVDFYADWCGPCQMLEPITEDIAEETDAAVAKVDVDAHQQLAAQYGVRGVPTVVLAVDGETAEQMVGVRDKSHYVSQIEQHLN